VNTYWFWDWLKANRIQDRMTLQRALSRPGVVDALLALAPPIRAFQRANPPELVELTGGNGIDLTGRLGCRHIDCLTKELDGLFRHAWHYFDTISVPDQASEGLLRFVRHKDVSTLCEDLEPFVLILCKIDKLQGLALIRFDVRVPPCSEHFREHAQEAQIIQAFSNTSELATDVARHAKITFQEDTEQGHRHIDYRLDSELFEHSEWGHLCSNREEIPADPRALRKAIAHSVIQEYLAALSADALAARHGQSPLGYTVPLYKKLLATHPSPTVEEVAFELALPVSNNASIASLIKLRQDEADSFACLQTALRRAITERLKSAGDQNSQALAHEIQRDVIDPEIRMITKKLQSARSLAMRGAAAGVGLGAIAATIGLLSPLGPVGVGLTVGGAITLGAQSLKKANDDELASLREVKLSDMYFLWKGTPHKH
jgi:hypothetical protein